VSPTLLVIVRYVLPLAMFAGAVVMLLVAPTRAIGLEGFAMGTGAALALLLMNVLWRFGFEGDKEREAEDAARAYLARHGRWPDEED